MRSFGQTQVGTHAERLGWSPHPGEMWFETDTLTLWAYDETAGWMQLNTSGIAATDTASIDLTLTGGVLSGVVLPAGVDHNSLANLTVGDVHTQYLTRSDWDDIFRFGFLMTYAGVQETTLTFDGTNTITLGPTAPATTWSYWRVGVKYTIAGNKTVTLSGSPPAAKGMYYIYIDATDGALTCDTTGWNLQDTKVPVCTVIWDNTLTPKFWFSDERHTCAIDRRFHWEHHFGDGTEVISMPTLTGPTVTGGTPTAADNTLAISAAVVTDEDLKHELAELLNPNATDTKYTIFYRSGLGNWLWVKSARPFIAGAARIQYDSAGTMTDATDNYYVNYYLLITNINAGSDQAARYVFIPGQAQYQTVTAAQAEKFTSITRSGLPINEFIAVYQFTWKCHLYGGAAEHGRLEATPQAIAYGVTGSLIPSDIKHNALPDLQGGAAGEYYHLTTAQSTLLTGTKAANAFLVGPASGADATPTWRTIVNADLAASAGTGSVLYAGASAPAWTAVADMVWDNTNKRLGVGIAPSYQLDVAAGAASSTIAIQTFSITTTHGSVASIRRSHSNTVGTLAETQSGELIGAYAFVGVNSSSAARGLASIRVFQDGAAGATYLPGRIEFWTGTDAAAEVVKAQLTNTGNLIIGTTTDTSTARLKVVGGDITTDGGISVGSATSDASAKCILLATVAATTVEGEMWFDSGQKLVGAYTNGMAHRFTSTLATQYSTVSSSAASYVTATSGSTIGSWNIPANFFVIGKTIVVEAWGQVEGSSDNPFLYFQLYFGSVVGTLFSYVSAGPGGGSVNGWHFKGAINCITAGSAGTANFSGACFGGFGGASGYISASPLTINTSASATVALKLSMSAAKSPANWKCMQAIMYVAN